jgi:hypothetical protein
VERKLTFFLASYAFRSKVLVIVKKIRDPEKIHPGSGSRGVKRVKKNTWMDTGTVLAE